MCQRDLWYRVQIGKEGFFDQRYETLFQADHFRNKVRHTNGKLFVRGKTNHISSFPQFSTKVVWLSSLVRCFFYVGGFPSPFPCTQALKTKTLKRISMFGKKEAMLSRLQSKVLSQTDCSFYKSTLVIYSFGACIYLTVMKKIKLLCHSAWISHWSRNVGACNL